jgi:hypothetical protein
MENLFNDKDIESLKARGISLGEAVRQMESFQKGFPSIKLVEPATLKQGIAQMSPKRLNDNILLYEEFASKKKIVKFVPASGAATRMFKKLLEFRNSYRATSEDQLELLKDKSPDSIYYFFEHLEEFAFFDKLYKAMYKRGVSYEDTIREQRYEKILNSLLTDKGLAYSKMPKALIPFHKYGKEVRTAFAEHLCEAARYARSSGNICHLHFTVSGEHLEMISQHLEMIRKTYEERFLVRFNVEFSIQDPSTDTITVDMNNKPIRDDFNEIVFRPGGHGSLIKNLNSIDSDIIIIKNIDNVCHDRHKEDTYFYKMALGGMLIFLQDQIFSFLRGLQSSTPPSAKVVDNMMSFIERKLQIIPPEGSAGWNKDKKIEYLKRKLNRPLRVCGMVENEGEPGGGPFLVRNPDGSLCPQIVELSQINMKNEEQVEILKKSSHFNPVDIVCSIKDFEGNTFNLEDFIDEDTGFISTKSLDGKEVKALERPGLWNGAMANWTSVFVEVPLTTFNPVKTVNDLLMEQHQEFSG